MAHEKNLIKTTGFVLTTILIISLPQGIAATPIDNDKIPSQHRVMAFYYPWYGGQGGDGKARHWGRIDAVKNNIEESRDYPLSGAYSSHEPKTIEQHCKWASQAGIDTFIVSWWGQGTYEDIAMPLILDTCQKFGMTACVYYETVPDPKTPQAAADDILRILDKYAAHSSYLKANGRPVVFIYGRAMEEIGLYGWHQTGQILNEKYHDGVALIGDRMSDGAACIFDGIHTYNTCGQLHGKSAEQISVWCKTQYAKWVGHARQNNRISTLTIIPGYDDTKIRKPGLNTGRLDGQLYQLQWQNAIIAMPDWILITSFNEWHEGSEIEPSMEYKDRYLKLTRQYAGQFKTSKAITEPGKSSFTENEYTLLRQKLQGKTIAVLPQPESAAFWFLLNCKINTRILGWDEVAKGLDPKTYPFLLYAGNETYLTTVHKPADVDEAIITYLKNGGVLLVFPSGPMPFYYNQSNKKVVNAASKFGLLLNQGWWEQPPQGSNLFYVQKNKNLPHLPPSFAFPKDGDLRWRPFISNGKTKSRSLLTLRDNKGKTYGDALVIVYLDSGGQVAYGWFGLIQEYSRQVMYDVLMLIN